MEAKENNNQSIICTLYCYTDGDWQPTALIISVKTLREVK